MIKIDLFINQELKSEDAMAGKENWLFTKRWNSEDMFRNKNLFTEEELNKIVAKLETLQAYMARNNTKFYLLLVPDKERIYGEFYPDGYTKESETAKIEQVYNYLKQNSDIPVIYPYEQMMKEKANYLLYYKTGTHWNHQGAYVAYVELFKRIKKDFPSLKILAKSDFNIEQKKEADIDIASALGIDPYSTFPAEDMTYDVFSVKNPQTSVTHKFVNKKKRIETFDYVSSNPLNKLKAIVYGDSMFLRMNWYVAESFSQMQHIYVGYGRDFDIPYMKEDIEKFAPNIFIVETGERFVNRLMLLDTPEE